MTAITPRRTRAALCLTTLALAVPALVTATTSASASGADRASGTHARQVAASMDFSPQVFVGGMQLRFTGNIGARGERVVRLQQHMNRPGDDWSTIDGFRRRTNRAGDFDFTYLAPAMRNKSIRVVAKGGLKTPEQQFNARAQDLEIGVPEVVAPGEPFDVTVDTTVEPAGDDVLASPVFPGRTLTVERLLSTPVLGYRHTWVPIDGATSTVNAQGRGTIEVPSGITEDTVLRVRQGNWTVGGDKVGWYPSFPMEVHVGSAAAAASADVVRSESTVVTSSARRGGEAGSDSAGERYGWRADFDFGWAYGESLDTPPHRGMDARGSWREATDGTGRVGPINGQLMIATARPERGRDEVSRGATMATLVGNPERFQRWEVRIRARSVDRNLSDDVTRVELVPADEDDYDCGANTITIAEYSPSSDKVRIGARKGGTEWSKRVDVGNLDNDNHAFAVEVARDHITWFREGQPIGTLGTKAALPSGPMTLRLSAGNEGGGPHNITQVYYDWMRSYPLDIGRKVQAGGSLSASPWSSPC